MATTLVVTLYGGSRQLLRPEAPTLVTLRNMAGKTLVSRFIEGNQIRITDVPTGGADDTYCIVVAAPRHKDAGFGPLPLRDDQAREIAMMLVPRSAEIEFPESLDWRTLADLCPALAAVLRGADPRRNQDLFAARLSDAREPMASLFNIVEALRTLPLQGAPVLPLFHEIDLVPDDGVHRVGIARDRFFGFADVELLRRLPTSADFEKEDASLHRNADASFKEMRFGEANLQFTFDSTNKKTIAVDGRSVECVSVEMDMDYFKDKAAHLFLEVIPNEFGQRVFHDANARTDPRQVYCRRWMAQKNLSAAGDFAPLFSMGPLLRDAGCPWPPPTDTPRPGSDTSGRSASPPSP